MTEPRAPKERVPVTEAAMVPWSVMVTVADCNVIEDERASEAAVLVRVQLLAPL